MVLEYQINKVPRVFAYGSTVSEEGSTRYWGLVPRYQTKVKRFRGRSLCNAI